MSSTIDTDAADSLRSLGQKWWLLAVFGVITFAFGVLLTFKPGKSVHTIAIILGIWLLILGVVRLIQAIGAKGERIGLLIVGLLAILVAILLLHHTTTTVAVLGFIIGIFWTIGGVAQLLHGFSANDGKVSWPVVALGVIATIIGILCLVYPSLSLSIICVITGLGLIVYGIVEVLASTEIRRLKAS
ncbi:MAG: HdeD family acid-resistance protein [Acidimicrobiales bacterium]